MLQYQLGLSTQFHSVNTSVQRPVSGKSAILLQFALLMLLLKLYRSKKRSLLFHCGNLSREAWFSFTVDLIW